MSMTHETVSRGGCETNDHLALTCVQRSKKEGFEQSRPESSEIRWKLFVVEIMQVGGICFWKMGWKRPAAVLPGHPKETSLKSCKFLFCF